MRRVSFIVFLGFLAASALASDQGEPAWHFVSGRYQLIGRMPDSTRTYAGTARIEAVGKGFRLTRTIGGVRTHWQGVVRRADPGEAWVLSFRRPDQRPLEMVCLVGSDLDNYARLTCLWGAAGNPHQQPGMEAFFALQP